MACRLTKLHSRLKMASLPSTTLRQSSSSQKILFSCHRRSNCRLPDFFATASNPRIFLSNPTISFPCLKPSYLPSPINRSRISQNRFIILASSPDTPKREINPNPSYPIPGDPPYPIPAIPTNRQGPPRNHPYRRNPLNLYRRKSPPNQMFLHRQILPGLPKSPMLIPLRGRKFHRPSRESRIL